MNTTPRPGRFDYVAYDQQSQDTQAAFKSRFEQLAALADAGLHDGRYRSLVLTKLEEAYAFVGKAIREDQWERTRSTPPKEERGADAAPCRANGLPQYRCHKLVRAAKVLAVHAGDSTEGPRTYFLQLEGGATRSVTGDWANRHFVWNPTPEGKPQELPAAAGGYFVEYEDGYTSWSPAKAFESGYTLWTDRDAANWRLLQDGLDSVAEFERQQAEVRGRG